MAATCVYAGQSTKTGLAARVRLRPFSAVRVRVLHDIALTSQGTEPRVSRLGTMTDALLTTRDAAAYLNVPVRTLRRNWRAWGLVAHRVGSQLRFEMSDVRRWLRDHRA